MQNHFTLTNLFCSSFLFLLSLGWHPRSAPHAPNLGEAEHGSHGYPSSQVLASRSGGRVGGSERCATPLSSTLLQQSASSRVASKSSTVEREIVLRGRVDKMTEAASNGSKTTPPTSEQQRTQRNSHSSSRKSTTVASSTAALLSTNNGEHPSEDIFLEENYEKIEVSCTRFIN